jgi:hypothetical protein
VEEGTSSVIEQNFFKDMAEENFMKAVFIGLFIFAGMVPVAFADVSIQNDQKYLGDDGTLHIVGEIQNNLDTPLNQIRVHATLYNTDNHVIGTKETRSMVNTIMPEMKGPFDFILTDSELKKTKTYQLDVDYKVSPPKNQVIDITSSKLSRDEFNNLMITGTVTNKGDITANTVAIVATIYDRDGNVAAVSRTHPEPDYLRTNDEMFFLITVPDKSQTMDLQEYSLVAESEEYAAVPEFPAGSVILLGGVLFAYIGIIKYSDRIITNLISATNLK